MTTSYSQRFPTLFQDGWNATGLADDIRKIDTNALADEYMALRETAPSRSAKGLPYFGTRHGRVRAKAPASPSEKHMAIALWRLGATWTRPDGGWFRLLDYQTPLRASRSDGLGEVDLLGGTDEGRMAVVELKVKRRPGSQDDTPLLALMEGLRYAAVLDANRSRVCRDAKRYLDAHLIPRTPLVQILAPEAWWLGWCRMGPETRRDAGDWEPRFLELTSALEARIEISVECVSIQNAGLADISWDRRGPLLESAPPLRPVHLDGTPFLRPALMPVAD